jgi:D-alanyl-D-alanine carboxypeptidase
VRTFTRWPRRHGYRRLVVALAVVPLVCAACSGGITPLADTATLVNSSAGVSTTSMTSAQAGSGLKSIDQASLQAMLDRTTHDLLIPGAVIVLRTPQGSYTVATGTTQLGSVRPPDADTHFRIASITKTMTSAMILQLAQEGKLGLDDSVSKYVPGVPNGDNVTLAELLEMRSGLFDYIGTSEVVEALDTEPTRVWTPQELLAIAFAHPPNFSPGTEYEYSNTNYVLLGLVAEKVDGKPLATSMQDRLFGPLGMQNTAFPINASNILPEPFSHGYLYGSTSLMMLGTPEFTPETAAAAQAGTLQPTDFTDESPSIAFAAGAAYSTANDLATWIKALVGGQVLGAEYQRKWLESIQLEDPGSPNRGYGYGIDRQSWGPNTVYLHGGQIPGYNSDAVYDPANDVTLVVWTNLTMSPVDGKFTASTLMVSVWDQIYALSPLAAFPLATTTTVETR